MKTALSTVFFLISSVRPPSIFLNPPCNFHLWPRGSLVTRKFPSAPELAFLVGFRASEIARRILVAIKAWQSKKKGVKVRLRGGFLPTRKAPLLTLACFRLAVGEPRCKVTEVHREDIFVGLDDSLSIKSESFLIIDSSTDLID